MKILILTCFIIFSCNIFSQVILSNAEFLTQTRNYQQGMIVKFTMQSHGQVWCMDDYQVRYLTDDYQTAEEIVRTNYCGGNFGFNECWHNQGWEQFGFGLYKMTISDIYSEERTYFYLDMRY